MKENTGTKSLLLDHHSNITTITSPTHFIQKGSTHMAQPQSIHLVVGIKTASGKFFNCEKFNFQLSCNATSIRQKQVHILLIPCSFHPHHNKNKIVWAETALDSLSAVHSPLHSLYPLPSQHLYQIFISLLRRHLCWSPQMKGAGSSDPGWTSTSPRMNWERWASRQMAGRPARLGALSSITDSLLSSRPMGSTSAPMRTT